MIERIMDGIDSLAFLPTRFKVIGISKVSGVPVHSMVVRPYLVFYKVERGAVFILEVRHGRRAPRTSLP
jgi:plasmid stabilization system protein ParE